MPLFKDEDEYSEDNNSISPPTPLPLRIIGLFFKCLFWAIVILINGVVLWRVFSSGDPASVKHIESNPELSAAYSAYLADTDTEKDPFAIYQKDHNTFTVEDADEENGITGNYGYFGLTDVTLFPSAGQVQVLFRYNDSTLEHLMEDYGLSEKPAKKEDWFDVTLRVEYGTVGAKTLVLEPEFSKRATKTLYTYYRLTFAEIPDFESITGIYVDIRYKGADKSDDPYGTITVYLDSYRNIEYNLSRKDRKALTR